MPKKETKKQKFIRYAKTIWKWAKKAYEYLKEFFSKKTVKISLTVLILIMFMLGFSMGWQCGTKGCNCTGQYNPPNPDDVNKIIRPTKK